MSTTITVGISDLNIAKAPDILVTYALGSCVGTVSYTHLVLAFVYNLKKKDLK